MISAPLLIGFGVGAIFFAVGLWLSNAAPATKTESTGCAPLVMIVGGFTAGICLLIQLVRLI